MSQDDSAWTFDTLWPAGMSHTALPRRYTFTYCTYVPWS